METSLFENAVYSIANGEYTQKDIKEIKKYLNELIKEEVKLKIKIDDLTSNFLKEKNKIKSDIKTNQTKIKQIKGLLRKIS